MLFHFIINKLCRLHVYFLYVVTHCVDVTCMHAYTYIYTKFGTKRENGG